ncbi:MAG TPA: DUF4489 domain-containing protein [Syntrophomonadaceae bacterium]|nr:DUF4489 domain-containing protein [Syntrophomonadaceae bacterium]
MNRVRVNLDEARSEERHERREREMETILKCGHGTGSGPLPVNMHEEHVFHPIVLASVVLDKKRLIDPTVKIDFSSLISFSTSCEEFLLNIVFRLSKICHEEERIPLGTWTFKESQFEEHDKSMKVKSDKTIQETESFCFTFCEEDEDRDDHCRFIVEIIDVQADDIDFAIVSNVFLTALANGFKRR